MQNDIEITLISAEQIQDKIAELGASISRDFAGLNPVLICILKGGVIFLADLLRSITIPVEIDFMSISSYGSSTQSSGVVKIKKDLDLDINGRPVIVVEDIVDSGLSLKYLLQYLQNHKPSQVKTCVLLDKPAAHGNDIVIDYCGFSVGNEFVVGYGLDYAGYYRNLPYIGILKKEVYSK